MDPVDVFLQENRPAEMAEILTSSFCFILAYVHARNFISQTRDPPSKNSVPDSLIRFEYNIEILGRSEVRSHIPSIRRILWEMSCVAYFSKLHDSVCCGRHFVPHAIFHAGIKKFLQLY